MDRTRQPRQFVWEEIYHRLESSRAALAENFEPSPEERARILRARAKLLAREPESLTNSGLFLEVVEFLLASEHYGVELSSINEICALKHLCVLPGTPDFVLGLIHVRQRIFSVIDIGRFFDLPQRGLTDLNKVLILKSGSMEVGILADAILTVRRVPADDLQGGLPTLTGGRANYLKAITKEALLILDVDKLLADKRILVDD